MTRENRGLFFGLLGVLSFALTLPATRYVVAYLDPVFIGLGRAVLASLFAATILLISRSPLPTKTQLKKLMVVALGVVIGFPVFSALAMQDLPASHGGVVLGILPIATAIAGVAISRDRPVLGFWLSGLVGAVLVVTYSLRDSGGELHAGDIGLFLATLSAAIGYAVGGELSKQMGGWRVICWALIVSLPFIIGPAYLTAPQDLAAIPSSAVWSFIYLALISQLFGFFLWYHGLALGGVTRVSQIQLVQPFVTLAAAAWLLNEQIDGSTLLFALLVVISVLVGKRMPIYNSPP